MVTNGKPYVWYRKSSENVDMVKKEAHSAVVEGFDAGVEYCVMYRKGVNGEMITINSQFIPDTLHAVLTVALYAGDSCNVESATKAGEITIDIPRLQLSGAMDISMTATGAAQTALEGNALASGCTGCDGKAIYATITKFISNSNWYDDAAGLIIEDLSGILVGDSVNKDVVVYAYYNDKTPKKLDNADLTIDFNEGTTGLTYAAGKITGTAAAGTAVISAVCKEKTSLDVNKAIVIA